MKIVKFSTTPDDEWMVSGNVIMYRCQEGIYDDDIEYKESSLAIAVSAMLDPRYPRYPRLPHIIERLQGSELGRLIHELEEGKLVFTPLAMFQEWEGKLSAYHEKLIELGELPDGMGVQEEDGEFLSWDLYLEIYCQQVALPERCWVEIEKSSGYELIEVVNRKPQYKATSIFSEGIEFEKNFEVFE